MKSITDIYLTTIGISPSNTHNRDTIIRMEKRCSELEEEFTKALTENQIHKFEDFMEAYMDVCSMENEDTFKRGFSIGARITAEAFLIDDNL